MIDHPITTDTRKELRHAQRRPHHRGLDRRLHRPEPVRLPSPGCPKSLGSPLNPV